MSEKTPPSTDLLDRTLDRFWETIPSFWGNIRAHIRSLATENFDISVEQFHIMRCIRKGHCTISEIAEVRNLSRPAISQGADALVSRGLLERTQNDADRRYVNLKLSDEGNTMLDEIFLRTRKWMKIDLAKLTNADLETLVGGLEILKKIIP